MCFIFLAISVGVTETKHTIDESAGVLKVDLSQKRIEQIESFLLKANSVMGSKNPKESRIALKNQFENIIETALITPYRIEPTKVEGEDVTRVEVWSNKKISYYNGSKEDYWTVDIYIFNSEDLIDGYYSHTFRPGNNEYGLNYGGKFISEGNANNGRPFVFSNKGEVDFIEKFAEAYNNMDADALSRLERVSEVDINTPDNQKLKLNFNDIEFWKSFFKGKESINWNIWAIIPIKIANTDPASGATVYSTHTTTLEDGQEIKEERVQLFFHPFLLENQLWLASLCCPKSKKKAHLHHFFPPGKHLWS